MQTKTCTRCNETKSVDEFHRNARAKDGRQRWCRVCLLGYVKQRPRRTLNPEKAKAARARWQERHPDAHRELERTKRTTYHAENRRRALQIYGNACTVPECRSDRLRLTYVDGPPEPYPVQRSLVIRIAKSGRRLPSPEMEILCVTHHLQKIARQRRNA